MDNWLYNNILSFLLAIIVVGGLIPKILIIAYRKKLFDGHDARKIHTGAVPRLGGTAFVPGIIFSVLLTLGLAIKGSTPGLCFVLSQEIVPLFFLFCSLMLLFLLGLADDLIEIRYRAKFFFQIVTGVLTIISGVWISNLHGFLMLDSIPEWAGWLITVFLIVYVINSLNLIDGIDGLAGGMSLIALLYFGYAFYDANLFLYSMVAFAGAGGLLPFIFYNIFGNEGNQRKIFMGDTGTLTLGMVIAFLAVEFTNVSEKGNVFAHVNPVLVSFSPLVIPFFDQLRVFFHRIVHRRNPFLPDRSHIHHKLLDIGLSTHVALVILICFSLLFILINWWMSALNVNVNWIVLTDFVVWTLLNMLLTKLIRRREKKLGEELYE